MTMWPRPILVPLPAATTGVAQPVLSLNGAWEYCANPPTEFWHDDADPSLWTPINIPRQLLSRDGLRAARQAPCAYRRRMVIPEDYTGLRIYLRLDGVSGYARLWVNGEYVRDHWGTYTPWCADITSCVSPGAEATIVLGLEARRVGSWHSEMSLLREIQLLALPPDHLTRFHAETKLDQAYRDALLLVRLGMAFQAGRRARIALTLRDAQGQTIPLQPAAIEIDADQPEATVEIPVAAPHLWDAEHPYLYTLEAHVVRDDGVQEVTSRQIGFRQIEIVERRLLVNGREVKLRGVNRHDIHPLTGRSVTPALCAQDARLFRQANMNFVRTSHYPPHEAFLDACDREGIYVDDETACMFVKEYEHNDPELTPLFLGQFSEMIERDRSHPCVIMWSMGNESAWGRNMQAQHDYARAEDPSRPLIFSWADLAPFGERPPFDIYSLHYAYYDGDPSEMSDLWVGAWWNPAPGKNITPAAKRQAQGNRPILHDEAVHIPAYDIHEQMRDPGVRNFWGETIKLFWDKVMTTDGALGAAIWAGIDDVVLVPGRGLVGREWGVIDGWRRPKPEYWLAQKAYSPVHIADAPLPNPGAGQALPVPVANWFDHTNLCELRILWRVGDEQGEISGTDLEPHHEGALVIPARDWRAGETVNLRFYWRHDLLVDEYNLPIAPLPCELPPPQGPAPVVEENTQAVRLQGHAFELVFDKGTGLITRGSYEDTEIICGGPYLHLEGVDLSAWSLRSMTARREENEAVVEIAGAYGPVEVRYLLRVDGQGLITAWYTIDRLPLVPPLPKAWVYLSSDVGGYREVGLSFDLSREVDRLSWQRRGLWSAYPADHIGRNIGQADREGPGAPIGPDTPPPWPWAEDARSYALYGCYDTGGRGTNDFRSLKEHIDQATAMIRDRGLGVRVESEGREAVRLLVLDNPQAMIDDRDPRVKLVGSWLALDDDRRSYLGTESVSKTPGDYADCTFYGTGICWLGARETYHGRADLYLDGQCVAEGIDLHSGFNMDMPMGQDKEPRAILFSQEGLSEGQHTIRVVVTGEKSDAAHNTYVSVDAFQVLGRSERGRVRLIVANEWNYPEVGWVRWGNYCRDAVLITDGYSNQVRLRLCGGETATL